MTDPDLDRNSPLAGTEVHELASEAIGDTFKIFVGHCGDLEASTPAPVLYVTDANGFFGTAVDTVRNLQLRAMLPPMLVVGVGYPMGGLIDTVAIRVRDLTPSTDQAFTDEWMGGTPSGGGPAFVRFLADELQPWVAARYAIDPNDATFFGHSFGGLLGSHVLLTEPGVFQRYILGSPSLWWNGNESFTTEAEFAARHDDLEATVFIGVGELETHEGRQRENANMPPEAVAMARARRLDMVDDTERFAAVLRSRNYPSLRLESVVLPDEFHVTVGPLHLSRGLRSVFDAPR
ncbi:MAG: alpha/beta hydrolase-fold protein [Acidimicrobiales bacterium]